ncbi:hypothetical protein B0H19DRAFT_1227282 [Mycena capillaripes]|nr:hypothetical protein B0H19DRAFT_1227282 [Mycena capillaripes]
MLQNNFAGVHPVDEFFENYMPPPANEPPSAIEDIVARCADALKTAKIDVEKAQNENAAAQPMITYLKEVVAKFSKENKPLVGDTHSTVFGALDEGDHHKMPDITLSRPGIAKVEKWTWLHAGTVIEAKHKVDIFDKDGNLNDSEESLKALVQLGKDARNLLMASSSCHVYLVTVFQKGRARLFRFDRAGFRATEAFNWFDEPTIFPTFLYRLYHPDSGHSRMHGQDDTISIPTDAEKKMVFESLCTHDFYNKMYSSEEEATTASLKIKAIRFTTGEDNERVSEVVDCFTIGPALSYSDGLFGRATHVYRVVLGDDIVKDAAPPVYALKDVWRQACRRPEIDFYDAIAAYCDNQKISTAGMAECHGSVDLSVQTDDVPRTWNPAHHITRSTVRDDAHFERCHMRVLLTPVGRRLETFKATKSLAEALYTAVLHHQIAYDAGVLHRDISDGNVLFEEATEKPKGFLLDWDYAEFTPQGLNNFNAAFPERKDRNRYQDIHKSLKDFTGTLPFVAIEIMRNTTVHGPHHDLESIYWLLVWMLLRHTKHTDPNGALACSELFDASGGSLKKKAWVNEQSPVDDDSIMFELVEGLRYAVQNQNVQTAVAKPTKWSQATVPIQKAQPIAYERILTIFRTELDSPRWPKNDAALEFKIPSVDPRKNEIKKAENVRRSVLSRQAQGSQGASLKRGHEEDSAPVASTSSGGTTAVSSGTVPRVKRVKKSEGEQ